MYLILCVDDNGGMRFNRRRQSRDRALRRDVLDTAAGGAVWMNEETRRQFTEEGQIRVDGDFLAKAGPGEFCFVEEGAVRPWLDKTEGIILYRWNRVYPADEHLDFDPAAAGWKLTERREFPGSSHEKITKEVYVK